MPTEPVQNAATSSSLLRADIPPKIGAKLTDDAAWIVIASRPTPEEAKLVAGQYVQEFPSTTVIRSMNGSFAVTIGWLNKEHGRPLKESLSLAAANSARLVSQQRGKIQAADLVCRRAKDPVQA